MYLPGGIIVTYVFTNVTVAVSLGDAQSEEKLHDCAAVWIK